MCIKRVTICVLEFSWHDASEGAAPAAQGLDRVLFLYITCYTHTHTVVCHASELFITITMSSFKSELGNI